MVKIIIIIIIIIKIITDLITAYSLDGFSSIIVPIESEFSVGFFGGRKTEEPGENSRSND